jgi:hypothetical protein
MIRGKYMNLRTLPLVLAVASGCSAPEVSDDQDALMPSASAPDHRNEPIHPFVSDASIHQDGDPVVPDRDEDDELVTPPAGDTAAWSPDFAMAALIRHGSGRRSVRFMDADGAVVREQQVYRDVFGIALHPNGGLLLQSYAHGVIWMEFDGTWDITPMNNSGSIVFTDDGEVILAKEWNGESYDADFQLIAALPYQSTRCYTDAVSGGGAVYFIDMFGTDIVRWDHHTIEIETVERVEAERLTVLGRDRDTSSLWFAGRNDHIWFKDLQSEAPAEPFVDLEQLGSDVHDVVALEPADTYAVYALLDRGQDEILRIDYRQRTIEHVLTAGPQEQLLDLVAF